MVVDNVDYYSEDPDDVRQLEWAKEWEEAMIAYLKEWEKSSPMTKYMEIGFYAERSIEDELERETQGDVVTIAISYLIMFAYITVALGKIDKPSRILVTTAKIRRKLSVLTFCSLRSRSRAK